MWPQPRGRKGPHGVGGIWVSSEVLALLGGFGPSFPRKGSAVLPSLSLVATLPELELDLQPAGREALQVVHGWSSPL